MTGRPPIGLASPRLPCGIGTAYRGVVPRQVDTYEQAW